jgi:hypothetical protein
MCGADAQLLRTSAGAAHGTQLTLGLSVPVSDIMASYG